MLLPAVSRYKGINSLYLPPGGLISCVSQIEAVVEKGLSWSSPKKLTFLSNTYSPYAMAEANHIYEKLGYPVVGQEECEDLTQALTSLADPGSSDGAVLANDVSGDVSGGNELNNVYYVNFDPKTGQLTPQLDAQLKAVKANVDLNNNLMSVMAGNTVNSKVASKEIPSDDEVKKANYKAKVINYLAQNSPWYVFAKPIRSELLIRQASHVY